MRTTRSYSRLGALVTCSCLLAAGLPSARARALSFEERVAAQEAIEQVYWSHRIWPVDNKGPKPPLSAVMPDAAIRAKVEDIVRMSTLLDSVRREPLTPAALQAEIARMVQETKAPGILRELFAALHDDPFLIAECLARPALLSRRVAAASAGGDLAEIAPTVEDYTLPSIPLGGCVNDAWGLSTLTNGTGANVPSARELHTALWTGSEMIVWGGWDGAGVAFATGGRYDPATDSWTLSSLTNGSGPNVPSARFRHTAIWTGTEMIVWGGGNAAGAALNNGGHYNPATDSWSLSSLTNASGANVPTARQFHTAVWTGTEMIIWGGAPDSSSNALNTGGRYDPATGTWTLSSLTNGTGPFVPVARVDHTAVWTGTEMIVWGGRDASGSGLKTGGRYDPATDSWALSLLTNGTGAFVPDPRHFHSAVWTGTEMVIWGGVLDGPATASNTGGRYNPSTNLWTLSSLTNATGAFVPTARQLHTALWTGSEMIVWGGSTDGSSSVLDSGGRYGPATDTWALSSLTNATGANVPSARQFHSAVWTGASDHRMIVWGGSAGSDTGGLFCAACPLVTWHADADDDGHGDPAVTQASCTQPPGYVVSGDDCDDTDPTVHPGATELCNALDDDCDTLVDDGGNTLCADGDACTADLCDSAIGCVNGGANLDTTDFSATRVDGRDLVVFAQAWSSCPGDPLYNAATDLDTVPCVDLADFHLFMTTFGHSCP